MLVPEYAPSAQCRIFPHSVLLGHNRHHFILFCLRFILISSAPLCRKYTMHEYPCKQFSNPHIISLNSDDVDVQRDLSLYICSPDWDLSVVQQLLTAPSNQCNQLCVVSLHQNYFSLSIFLIFIIFPVKIAAYQCYQLCVNSTENQFSCVFLQFLIFTF